MGLVQKLQVPKASQRTRNRFTRISPCWCLEMGQMEVLPWSYDYNDSTFLILSLVRNVGVYSNLVGFAWTPNGCLNHRMQTLYSSCNLQSMGLLLEWSTYADDFVHKKPYCRRRWLLPRMAWTDPIAGERTCITRSWWFTSSQYIKPFLVSASHRLTP